MKWIIVLIAVTLIAYGIPAVSAEKMWKDGIYVDYRVYTGDDNVPGILEAPSWLDVPVDQPGFRELFNSVPSSPFEALPDMTYSDVREIRRDNGGQSWEESFLPSQPAITIGIPTPPISEPPQVKKGLSHPDSIPPPIIGICIHIGANHALYKLSQSAQPITGGISPVPTAT